MAKLKRKLGLDEKGVIIVGAFIMALGLYTNQKRKVLYTVLSRKEIGALVQSVKQIDPHAFVIVNNVHEVLGEGFRPRI